MKRRRGARSLSDSISPGPPPVLSPSSSFLLLLLHPRPSSILLPAPSSSSSRGQTRGLIRSGVARRVWRRLARSCLALLLLRAARTTLALLLLPSSSFLSSSCVSLRHRVAPVPGCMVSAHVIHAEGAHVCVRGVCIVYGFQWSRGVHSDARVCTLGVHTRVRERRVYCVRVSVVTWRGGQYLAGLPVQDGA